MPGDQRFPSYEELAGLVVELRAELTRTRKELAEARERVADLEARVGRNSRNSSTPPSAEGLDKPPPKSLREKTGRRPGGQAGHPGSTLCQVECPDRVERHEPAACGRCGSGLAGAAQAGVERRQVFDVPPICVTVTEHQLIKRRCGCGAVTCGRAPDGVDAPVQYGPRAAAVIVFLYVGQFLSKNRTAQALADLFGTPISGGTVAEMTRRAATRLADFTIWVRDRLTDAAVAYFDETGFRVEGRLAWVHSASTGKYVLITCHRRRGVEAMDAAGVLPDFTGIAVHDAWAPYDTYTHAGHALCNAHALRELQAVIDTTGDETGHQWCWAAQAADALRQMKHLVNEALAADGTPAGLDTRAMDAARHSYRSAARLGARHTAARSSDLMKKHNNLARRLIDRQDDYLRFTRDPRVPFDNNAAEQEIRMIKLRQKVSGCMRTLTGARQFCAIRSYLATAAKHGISFFRSLVQLAEGNPWMPATA
jgi:transposase